MCAQAIAVDDRPLLEHFFFGYRTLATCRTQLLCGRPSHGVTGYVDEMMKGVLEPTLMIHRVLGILTDSSS